MYRRDDALRTARLALLPLLLFHGAAFAALTPDSASEFHEKAIQLEAQDDALAAIIELKNALQRDPEHLPSLVLAGRIYLDQSLGLAAEESLRSALEAGGDRSLILPLLGEALMMQDKAARVLVELQADDLTAQAAARVHATRAQAHLRRRELAEARTEIEAAQALVPDLLEAQLAEATRLMLHDEPGAAREAVATAVAAHPDSSKAWGAYGAVHHALRDVQGALEGYAKAIDAEPRNIDIRIARVGLLIDLGRDAEALPDLDYLDEKFPEEPRAAYLRSVIASRAGDAAAARTALERAVTSLAPMAPEAFAQNPALQLIQGLAHYGLQQYEAAAAPLQSYIAKKPDDLGARKALGDILLRLGAPQDAIPVLEPVVTLAPQDGRAQLLLATAYAISGYANKASALLESVGEDAPSASAARGRLAMLNIGAGRVDSGLSELAAAFAADPSDAQGGVALVVTYLRTGQHEEAVAAARKLLATRPNNLVFRNLLGITLLVDEQLDEARRLFEGVLEDEPDFRPAAINLGKLEVRDGDLAAAKARFERLLTASPGDTKLLLELSRVALAAGDRREGLRLAEDAARSPKAPTDALFHLYDLYMADGQLERAYDLALRARAVAEGNFTALERLALVLIRMDKFEDARAVLKNMSQVAGFDIARQLRTAALQSRIGQFGDAEYSLYKVAQENAADERIRLAQVELSLRKHAFGEAEERATALIEAYPELPAAWLLRGHARLSLKKHPEALADYERVNEFAPSTVATLGGYRTLAAAGDMEAAQAHLKRWLEKHPRDHAVRTALGEALIQRGELAQARDTYSELVDERPDDPDLLNNLAYLQLQLGELEVAEKNARKAYAAAPQSAMVNDTLGWILVQRGVHEEALPYLRDALARRAGDGDIRYHLAFVLERLGRRDEARTHLAQALREGSAFASRAAALALLDSLGPETR